MGRISPFIYASDLHGDQANQEAVNKLLEVSALIKPKIKVFGGDLFDFRAWRKGASIEDKCGNMQSDWQSGVQFIKLWRPTHLLLGNHDWRLYEKREDINADVSMLATQLVDQLQQVCKKIDCKIIPYGIEHRLQFGKLAMLHGVNHGTNGLHSTAMNFGHVVMGHIHSVGVAPTTRSDRAVGYSAGCLCNPVMEYNQRQVATFRHTNGFIHGLLHPDGSYDVAQAKKDMDSGRWTVPYF